MCLVRTFIIKANKAHTRGDFSLKDLPGTSGRIDLLCRALNSAFLLSRGFRKDVKVWVNLNGSPDPPKTIRFEGSEIKPKIINPDERSLARIILTSSPFVRVWLNPSPVVGRFEGLH